MAMHFSFGPVLKANERPTLQERFAALRYIPPLIKLVWETQAVTKEHVLWASAYPVRNGDRYFITNDRGELIIAKLSPAGYDFICLPVSLTGRGGRPKESSTWYRFSFAIITSIKR